MLILGLASSHDASACVLRDGSLLAAVQQERVTRLKNDGYRLPWPAVDHALSAAGVARRDIDAIATIHGFFPEKYFRRESLAKEVESRLVRARRSLRPRCGSRAARAERHASRPCGRPAQCRGRLLLKDGTVLG